MHLLAIHARDAVHATVVTPTNATVSPKTIVAIARAKSTGPISELCQDETGISKGRLGRGANIKYSVGQDLLRRGYEGLNESNGL
jgi:hypothetical protein